MKTQHAIDLAGTPKALAELLEITPSAISQWGEDMPQAREWQMKLLKPEWFVPPVEQGAEWNGKERRKQPRTEKVD